MGHSTHKALGISLLTLALSSTTVLAGGFDRGAVNIDQLFDSNRFTADANLTYVNPNRKQLNIRRNANAANPGLAPLTSSNVDGNVSFVVPRFGYKAGITDDLNCLFSYSQPFGADQNNGTNNALSASSVEFGIDTDDYGATCAYSFAGGETSVGDSRISIIGGISYQEFDGFLSRQSLLDFSNAGLGDLTVGPGAGLIQGATSAATGIPAAAITSTASNTAGLGTFSVSGDAIGWRAGVAYEIPKIALRASIVYNSAYDYDLTGTQNNTGFGVAAGSPNAVVPISLTTEIPQSIDIKLQSGISEGTLAFLNARWQDWSKLGSIPIVGGVTSVATANPGAGDIALPTTLAFEPLYRDGYTITAGIGKVLTDDLSGLVSLTWDRGTSTTVGSQSDTYTLATGVNYKPTENLEVRLGGAIGILSGGQSTGRGTTDQANQVFYEFDADYVYALSGGFKYKF